MRPACHSPTEVSDVPWEVLQLVLPRLRGARAALGESRWTCAASSMAFSTAIQRDAHGV
jgi:hypothetical protein